MAITSTIQPATGDGNTIYTVAGFSGGPLNVSKSNIQQDMILLAIALVNSVSGGGGPPTGAAGGDLFGTYPNPQVKAVRQAGGQLIVDTVNQALLDSSGERAILFSTAGRNLLNSSGLLTLDWNNGFLMDLSSTIISVDWINHTMSDGAAFMSLDWSERNLFDTAGVESVDWTARLLADSTVVLAIDWQNRLLSDSNSLDSLDWGNRNAVDSSGVEALSWFNRILEDAGGIISLDWLNRVLFDNGGIGAVDWQGKLLVDNSGMLALDWGNRQLLDVSGAPIGGIIFQDGATPWQALVIGSGLTLAGNTLSAAGGGIGSSQAALGTGTAFTVTLTAGDIVMGTTSPTLTVTTTGTYMVDASAVFGSNSVTNTLPLLGAIQLRVNGVLDANSIGYGTVGVLTATTAPQVCACNTPPRTIALVAGQVIRLDAFSVSLGGSSGNLTVTAAAIRIVQVA